MPPAVQCRRAAHETALTWAIPPLVEDPAAGYFYRLRPLAVYLADHERLDVAECVEVVASCGAVSRRTTRHREDVRLVIAPRIAGRGRRLLDGLPPIQLESIRSNISPTGHLLADYRVVH
jgi:hypothetical protein